MNILNKNVYSLTSGWQVYVAKISTLDSCIWLKASSHSHVYSSYLKTDKNFNVFLAGSYLDTLTIDAFTIVDSGFNSFLYKMNSNANGQWIYNIGSSNISDEVITAIDVDQVGSIYATGSYHKPLVIGNTILTTTGQNNLDIFLMKLDINGQPIWATKAGGLNTDYSRGLMVNKGGDLYVCGQYISSVSMGSLSLNSVASSVNSAWPWEAFVVKFNSSGTPIWATQGDCDSGGGVAASSQIAVYNSDIFLTGSFSGTVDFGGHPQSVGSPNMFITKINDATATNLKVVKEYSDKINLYPNPNSGIFYLEGIDVTRPIKMNVFNVDGTIVYTNCFKDPQNKMIIDLRSLLPGIYFLKMTQHNYKEFQKVVITD